MKPSPPRPPRFSEQLLELAHGHCPDCAAGVSFAPGDAGIATGIRRSVVLIGRCRGCRRRWRVEIPDPFTGSRAGAADRVARRAGA